MSYNIKSKKEKVLIGNKKRIPIYFFIIPVFILITGIVIILNLKNNKDKLFNFGNTLVKYERLKAENGRLSIPLTKFDDLEAKYFVYKFPEGDVPFFAIKSKDGVVRAAFDACDVCFRARKGYRQEGNFMVCNNCGQVFPSERINIEKGGCNPAPLNREIQNNNLIFNVDDIYKGLYYFSADSKSPDGTL